jgi:hypothetical protein
VKHGKVKAYDTPAAACAGNDQFKSGSGAAKHRAGKYGDRDGCCRLYSAYESRHVRVGAQRDVSNDSRSPNEAGRNTPKHGTPKLTVSLGSLRTVI